MQLFAIQRFILSFSIHEHTLRCENNDFSNVKLFVQIVCIINYITHFYSIRIIVSITSESKSKQKLSSFAGDFVYRSKNFPNKIWPDCLFSHFEKETEKFSVHFLMLLCVKLIVVVVVCYVYLSTSTNLNI